MKFFISPSSLLLFSLLSLSLPFSFLNVSFADHSPEDLKHYTRLVRGIRKHCTSITPQCEKKLKHWKHKVEGVLSQDPLAFGNSQSSFKKWVGMSSADLIHETRDGILAAHEIHRIDALKKLGYSGQGQTVGVLEQYGSDPSQLAHSEIRNHLADGSQTPGRGDHQHGTHITSIISSDKVSIAPRSRVHYEYGDEVFSRSVVSSSSLTLEFKPIFLEPTTAHGLQGLLDKKTTVVNLARTLPMTPETQQQIGRLAENDGLIFKALGNHGQAWNYLSLNDMSKFEGKHHSLWNDFQRAFAVESLFYLWLREPANQKYSKAFIFVANLNSDGRSLFSSSNLPGNIFPERTLSAIGTNFLNFKDPATKQYSVSDGTSNATAIATGVFALLKQAYPNCSDQAIGQAMLDSAHYKNLGLMNNKNQWVSAESLPLPRRQLLFGRGILDAEAAFRLAQEKGYCSQTPVQAN